MKQLIILAFFAVSLVSCKKNPHNGANGIFRGPVVNVHGGQSWTWIQVNNEGNPERIGLTLTDKVLANVPVGTSQAGHGHGHTSENNWVVKFHPKASILPFNHVGLNWNPVGHEPEPIYGKPHFDFHFYLPTPEEIDAIPDYNADSVKFNNFPAPEYFPPTYINPGGGVAKMGAHWVDFTSPELNGQPFGETFIYGSYDGMVTFYEPMITLDFLKTNSNYHRTVPQPAKVQKSGWYPTEMRVAKHDGVTELILDAFVYRMQS